jgi:hypothetical protein
MRQFITTLVITAIISGCGVSTDESAARPGTGGTVSTGGTAGATSTPTIGTGGSSPAGTGGTTTFTGTGGVVGSGGTTGCTPGCGGASIASTPTIGTGGSSPAGTGGATAANPPNCSASTVGTQIIVACSTGSCIATCKQLLSDSGYAWVVQSSNGTGGATAASNTNMNLCWNGTQVVICSGSSGTGGAVGTGGSIGTGGMVGMGGAVGTGGASGIGGYVPFTCSVNGYSFTNDWACRPQGTLWCANPANLGCNPTASLLPYDGTPPSVGSTAGASQYGYCFTVNYYGQQFDGSYGKSSSCPTADPNCWAMYPTAPYFYITSNKQWIVRSPNGFGCRGFHNSDGSWSPAQGGGAF